MKHIGPTWLSLVYMYVYIEWHGDIGNYQARQLPMVCNLGISVFTARGFQQGSCESEAITSTTKYRGLCSAAFPTLFKLAFP